MLKTITEEATIDEMLEVILSRAITAVYLKPEITVDDIDLIEKTLDLAWTLDHMNTKPTV